jgi:hypothetical protein
MLTFTAGRLRWYVLYTLWILSLRLVCTLESPPALERGLQNLLESLLAESALG